MKDLIILGGGLAGLAAGYAAARRETPCRIIEALPVTGGLARTVRFGDIAGDLGPHRIYTEYPEIKRLLEETCGDLLMRVPRKSRMFVRRGYVDYPFGLSSLGDLAREFGALELFRCGVSFLLDQVRPASEIQPSYETYVRRAFGSRLYEILFQPYARKVWGVAPSMISEEVARLRISAGSLWKQLRRMALGDSSENPTSLPEFSYLRGGIGGLGDRLAASLTMGGGRIECSATVTGFQFVGNRITHVVVQDASGRHAIPTDAVISTIPLPRLLEMLLPHRRSLEIAQICRKLAFVPLDFSIVEIARGRASDDTWLYFPSEEIVFNRIYEPKNFDAGMAPKGRSSLCVETTRKGDEAAAESRIEADLRTCGLAEKPDIRAMHTLSEPYAYPLYYVGFRKDLRKIQDYLRQFENLISTGRQGLYHHNNMDSSLLMGLKSLAYATRNPDTFSGWYDGIEEFEDYRIID